MCYSTVLSVTVQSCNLVYHSKKHILESTNPFNVHGILFGIQSYMYALCMCVRLCMCVSERVKILKKPLELK